MAKTEGTSVDLVDRIGLLAPELVRRLDLVAGGRLRDGISHPQYKVLAVLQASGPVSMGVVGSMIGAAQSSASELASRMEKVGLVQKTRSPEDSRVVLMAITDQGRNLLHQCRKRLRAAYGRLFADAGAEAPAAFLASIETLLAILDRKPGRQQRREVIREER
jgi:DNA-binding MarR family transcriptional regulator